MPPYFRRARPMSTCFVKSTRPVSAARVDRVPVDAAYARCGHHSSQDVPQSHVTLNQSLLVFH
jgi:hypothetical protein